MKRKLLILLTATTLFSSILTGCNETPVSVNVENKENLHNTVLGKSAFVYIGDDLCYDSATRIVYMKMYTYMSNCVYNVYYAPNGLPYKYNPETNTFEEIDLSEFINLETEEQ